MSFINHIIWTIIFLLNILGIYIYSSRKETTKTKEHDRTINATFELSPWSSQNTPPIQIKLWKKWSRIILEFEATKHNDNFKCAKNDAKLIWKHPHWFWVLFLLILIDVDLVLKHVKFQLEDHFACVHDPNWFLKLERQKCIRPHHFVCITKRLNSWPTKSHPSKYHGSLWAFKVSFLVFEMTISHQRLFSVSSSSANLAYIAIHSSWPTVVHPSSTWSI